MGMRRIQNPGEEPQAPIVAAGWGSWGGWGSDLHEDARQMAIRGEAMRAAGRALREATEREARLLREAAETEEP